MQRLEDETEHKGPNHSSDSGSPLKWQDESNLRTGLTYQHHKLDVPISLMNYHLDDLEIPLIEGVDAFDIPPREIADEYFNTYLTYVHPLFSVIRRTAFTAQVRQFYSRPSKPPKKWLAILNMIFAIGCRYSRLIDPSREGSDQDDLLFLTRARRLSLHEKVLFDHTDLQQIQLELLVAIYMLCLGQVNRYVLMIKAKRHRHANPTQSIQILKHGSPLRALPRRQPPSNRRQNPRHIQRSPLSPLVVHLLHGTPPNLNARTSLLHRRKSLRRTGPNAPRRRDLRPTRNTSSPSKPHLPRVTTPTNTLRIPQRAQESPALDSNLHAMPLPLLLLPRRPSPHLASRPEQSIQHRRCPRGGQSNRIQTANLQSPHGQMACQSTPKLHLHRPRIRTLASQPRQVRR